MGNFRRFNYVGDEFTTELFPQFSDARQGQIMELFPLFMFGYKAKYASKFVKTAITIKRGANQRRP